MHHIFTDLIVRLHTKVRHWTHSVCWMISVEELICCVVAATRTDTREPGLLWRWFSWRWGSVKGCWTLVVRWRVARSLVFWGRRSAIFWHVWSSVRWLVGYLLSMKRWLGVARLGWSTTCCCIWVVWRWWLAEYIRGWYKGGCNRRLSRAWLVWMSCCSLCWSMGLGMSCGLVQGMGWGCRWSIIGLRWNVGRVWSRGLWLSLVWIGVGWAWDKVRSLLLCFVVIEADWSVLTVLDLVCSLHYFVY